MTNLMKTTTIMSVLFALIFLGAGFLSDSMAIYAKSHHDDDEEEVEEDEIAAESSDDNGSKYNSSATIPTAKGNMTVDQIFKLGKFSAAMENLQKMIDCGPYRNICG
jgi:hypothetical protein